MSDPDDGTEGGGMDDEELAETADELSDVLRDLRDELRASRAARETGSVERTVGSGGGGPTLDIDLPSPTDVLAFTDETLIPAAITILEVNIRALELLQKGIRWARPDRAGENARRVQSHAESVSRSTLERLDTVLAELQDSAGDGSLPENAEASGIISEARRLRDEIDAALAARADARGESDERGSPPADDEAAGDDDTDEGPPSPWDEQPEVDVDVEGELQSIKAELGKADADETPDDDEETEADEGERTAGQDASSDDEAESQEDEDDPGEGAGDVDPGEGADGDDPGTVDDGPARSNEDGRGAPDQGDESNSAAGGDGDGVGSGDDDGSGDGAGDDA